MLLSKSLAQQSATLLAKMSNPVLMVNQQSTQVICAIKWQNSKKMTRKQSDLKPGDLVLLEMKMTRYLKKIEDKWHSRAQYEMIAISLLNISNIIEEETQGTNQIDGEHGDYTHDKYVELIIEDYPNCILSIKIIERLLPAGEPQEPLVLFPKERQITHWYYHIYFTSTPDDNRNLHPVLKEIFGKRCPQGEVVIVKNGEKFTPDSPEFDVDCEDLGRTLWWYIKSGRDPVEEASERRLIHYIQHL
ncbi:hypothetical protein BD769DRAFT_1394039 [Suillus cothurnatus]|nr:hypothetical protein BD769DRAFT_1394039 [Suillus cothurnatus]